MSALDEHLKKHRKKIIDREEKTFREMLSAYAEIEKELKKSFTALQKQIETAQANNEKISLSWFYRQNRLKNLLSQVQEQITRFGGKSAKIIENEQRAAIDIAISQTDDNFSFQIKQNTEGDANLPDARNFSSTLNPRTVETAVGIMGDGSPIIDYFEQQLAPMVADKIKTEVIKAAAIGTDFKTIGKNLEQTGQITKYRALSVARTEVNRVRREATREIYEQNDDIIEGWEWVASKSNRTCILCLAMDGKIFPLNEPFPQHINCRCTLIAVIKGLPRRPRTIGKDWFETQDDETKAKILGQETFDAYKENDLNLDDFVTFRNHKLFGKSVARKPLAKILADKGINPKDKKPKLPKVPANPKSPKTPKINKTNVPDFKNVKEAQKWVETTYPHLQADFTQTKIEAIQPTIKEFVKLSDEFPEVNKRLEYIGTYRDKTKKYNTKRGFKFTGEFAHASVNGKRLGLNPKFFNNSDLYQKTLDQCKSTNWLVSETFESVIRHEFGHQVEHWLKSIQLDSLTGLYSNSGKYELRELLNKFYEKFHTDLNYKTGTNYADWKKRKEELSNDVSRYAVKNEAELWAESFSAITNRPESIRGQFLKEFLDEIKNVKFNKNPKAYRDATDDERQAADKKLDEILKKFEFIANFK